MKIGNSSAIENITLRSFEDFAPEEISDKSINQLGTFNVIRDHFQGGWQTIVEADDKLTLVVDWHALLEAFLGNLIIKGGGFSSLCSNSLFDHSSSSFFLMLQLQSSIVDPVQVDLCELCFCSFSLPTLSKSFQLYYLDPFQNPKYH